MAPVWNFEYKYDEDKNEIESLVQEWNGSSWLNYSRKINSYKDNKLVEILNQSWENSWINIEKLQYTYNEYKNPKELIKLTAKNNLWKFDNKKEFSYDDNQNLIEELEFNWIDSLWSIYMKTFFIYNNSNLVEKYRLKWNGQNYLSDRQEAYSYDERNNLIQTSISYGDSSSWGLQIKIFYTYDDSNRLTEKLVRDYANEIWYDSLKEIFFYDDSGNLIEKIRLTNNNGNILVNDSRWRYYYNEKNNITCIFLDLWEKNTTWFTFGYVKYVYETPTSIVWKEKEINGYYLDNNFPNPFNPATIIRYTLPEQTYVTLSIFDILGNKVATLIRKEQNTGNYEVEFNGTGIASGIYFYILQTTDFIDTKKMLLLK